MLQLFPAEGKTIDATQEMLALGLCNIASSFAGSMPVSGALSRGAVNNASGVKTTFGGIYTGWFLSDVNYDPIHSFNIN